MKKKSQGFTLIELIISLGLVGVVSALSISMLLQGTEIFMKAKQETRLLNESRTAIWRVTRELHNLASAHLLALSSDSRLYIEDANSSQIDFNILDRDVLNINRAGEINPLSEFMDERYSNTFKYISSENDTINFSGSLTESEANKVNLLKIDFRFAKEDKILDLETHVYPYNLRFGKKMSYHE